MGGFVDVCFADVLFRICPVRDPVDVPPDGRQLPQQGGVGFWRLWLDFGAADKLAEQTAGRQAGACAQFPQLPILAAIQPKTDKIGACPDDCHRLSIRIGIASHETRFGGVGALPPTRVVCLTDDILAATAPQAALFEGDMVLGQGGIC